ncbi:MAG: glycosyltransferase family 2 protein [Oxalobacter sp.]|nr:MAG: glycosyltransferase family 2 protein [Oxalobacter sp.]
MSFKPCLLIPIYNHKASIRSMVERLAIWNLPIFIVDDGSDLETQNVLNALAKEVVLVRLSRLSVNSGKGAAVMHGMRLAHADGFTHALQIDADGQHNPADVPHFLDRGKAHPHAAICGTPIYDGTVPKGRLYGRYITHFWVWVETLSFAIQDSLCGYRLYPLAATCALINEVKIPTRMDFDTAIIVHLFWRGVGIENIPTRVTYPPDGLSHFNLWHDNLRITKMHTLLTCGMLIRLPVLLWRKIFFEASKKTRGQTHWSRLSERGSTLGMQIVYYCYQLIGERAALWLLYPIVAYFYLTSPRTRHASLDYLRKVHAHSQIQGRAPNQVDVFRHMLAFAQSGLDKLAAWMGKTSSLRVDVPNLPAFQELVASGQGALFIGAHLGNLEMSRALSRDLQGVKINAIVFSNHAQRFHEMLMRINPEYNLNLIQVSQIGPDTVIHLREKINHGEMVFIVGDRTPPAENGRVTTVDFFDAPTPFAQGPMILASFLECPVFLFFCLREKDKYTIYLERFADQINLPRKDRQQGLQTYLQAYAKRLETYCLKAPYQWFNFFDFWQGGKP